MGTDDLLAALGRFDTPTVCNAIERVAPERTGFGFTTKPLVCAHPDLPPVVGWARTATIRASHPPERSEVAEGEALLEYYRHVAEEPRPTLTVVEDIDPSPGYGAWWGEVHTHVHRGLGSLGVITNGAVRDLPIVAAGFQILAGSVAPSHAFVHPVEWNVTVTVAGMTVRPGDLIHADRHGAVVIPVEVAEQVPAAAEQVMREESVLIDASKRSDFGLELLERLLGRASH